jgi:hypothetical protein
MFRKSGGVPSFTKQWLAAHNHPVAEMIMHLREVDKADSTFIDSILRHEHDGRIHTEFHQLRSDDGGTVTGRFSSSNPNLQQIPARDPEIKRAIRGLFLPEEGQMWGSFDYSSQEPRLLVHFAASMPDSPAQPRGRQHRRGVPPRRRRPAPDGGRHCRHYPQAGQGRQLGHHVRHGRRQAGRPVGRVEGGGQEHYRRARNQGAFCEAAGRGRKPTGRGQRANPHDPWTPLQVRYVGAQNFRLQPTPQVGRGQKGVRHGWQQLEKSLYLQGLKQVDPRFGGRPNKESDG